MLSQPVLPTEAADGSIMIYCRRTTDGFTKMQGPKLLTLGWLSFLGSVNERVIWVFRNNAGQYIHSGRMWQYRPLIVECGKQKIVDTLLTLTLITLKQPSYTQ